MKLNNKYLIVLIILVILFATVDRFTDFKGIEAEEKNIYHKVKNAIIPGYSKIKKWLVEKASVIFTVVLSVNMLINALSIIL